MAPRERQRAVLSCGALEMIAPSAQAPSVEIREIRGPKKKAADPTASFREFREFRGS